MIDKNLRIDEIMRRLPQRYPFLMIDRVVDCTPNESLSAYKNLTINEPFFQGHFPQLPLMPGVLIMEAMAQATGLLAYCSTDSVREHTIFLFVGIDKARFKRQVEPGDRLDIVVNLLRKRRSIWVFEGEAKVGDELAATAEIMCAEQKVDF